MQVGYPEAVIAVAGFATMLASNLFGLLNQKRARLQREAMSDQLATAATRNRVTTEAVAAKVEFVQKKVEIVQSALEDNSTVAHQTHVLVNSRFGNLLRTNADLARRIASLTNDPIDMDVATSMEAELHAHNERQARADAIAAERGISHG